MIEIVEVLVKLLWTFLRRFDLKLICKPSTLPKLSMYFCLSVILGWIGVLATVVVQCTIHIQKSSTTFRIFWINFIRDKQYFHCFLLVTLVTYFFLCICIPHSIQDMADNLCQWNTLYKKKISRITSRIF